MKERTFRSESLSPEKAQEFAVWASHYGVSVENVRGLSLSDLIMELISLERRWSNRSDYESPDNLRKNFLIKTRMDMVRDRIDDIGTVR